MWHSDTGCQSLCNAQASVILSVSYHFYLFHHYPITFSTPPDLNLLAPPLLLVSGHFTPYNNSFLDHTSTPRTLSHCFRPSNKWYLLSPVLAFFFLLFVPEDEETIVLCNTRNHSTHDTVKTRRTESPPGYLLTYLLTPWSRVLLEKLTSKLCR